MADELQISWQETMKIEMDIHKNHLLKAMSACVENGQRLHKDAEWLGEDRSASTIALCILAQEEFAKAFLLHLVCEGTIPWTPKVRESLRNHRHKQLVGLIMEWLSPSFDEFSARIKKNPVDFNIPVHIADAIKLFVEKVQPQGHIACPPAASNARAKSIAYGDRDKMKQDAFYVRLSDDGEVISIPALAPPEMVEEELDRTNRLSKLVSPLREGTLGSVLDYHLLLETMSFLLLDKSNRPFLILKESEFGGPVSSPTGITWPHSIKVLIENISHEQANCVSMYATIFLDNEAVRPSFLCGQFVVDPYTANLCTFFLSEEAHSCGLSPSHELKLYVNLEYHGVTLDCKYHIFMWSTYDPSTGTFRERLTDLQESVNGGPPTQGGQETKWMWPTKN